MECVSRPSRFWVSIDHNSLKVKDYFLERCAIKDTFVDVINAVQDSTSRRKSA
jgi:hypothetical protein